MIRLCGIWESEDLNGPINNKISYSIVTRETFKPVAKLSDEMPVVLRLHSGKSWLDQHFSINDIIHEMEQEDWSFLKYYSDSPKIKDIGINSALLIKLVQPTDQYGNLSLFD